MTRADQAVPLPPRLTIAEVRGYPGQARRAARLLAETPGVSPARQTAFLEALHALGRHPDDYSNGVTTEITAQMPASRRGRHVAAGPARHRGAERRRGTTRHRHRVPARPAGGVPAHPVGDQAARRRAAGRPGRAVRGRVQVARRPDHADPGPRRPPARLRRDGRAAGGRVAGRPGAVPRLPGPAPHAGVPPAGGGAALAPVPGPHRPLAQGAARGSRRGPPPQGPHRRRARRVADRPDVPPGHRAGRRDHRGLGPRVPARPAQALQGTALRAGVLRPAARPGGVPEGRRRPEAAAGLPGRVPGRRGAAPRDRGPGRRDAGRTCRPGRYAAGHG